MSSSIKTYYTPLEASVRLSGLIQFEADILEGVGKAPWPDVQKCAHWPALYLYLCRIHDALLHHELACTKAGMVYQDEPLPLDDPNLAIRHVDLRKWIQSFYPYEAHPFLFGPDYVSQTISERAFQVLRTELEAKEIELARSKESLNRLQTECESLSRQYGELAEMQKLGEAEKEGSSHRRVLSDLNIIDSLRLFLLGERIVGNPRTPFKSGNALINALVKSFPQRPGMSERTLRARFAEATRLARENR
ncbi:MAG: hypothetical protein FWG52_09340 [Proteobacteria bacterium]|nr:hypothetical protein [Pseudomonadota bacterium]